MTCSADCGELHGFIRQLIIFRGGQKEILKSFFAEYIHKSTMTNAATTTNAKKVAQLEKALAEMLAATLEARFLRHRGGGSERAGRNDPAHPPQGGAN